MSIARPDLLLGLLDPRRLEREQRLGVNPSAIDRLQAWAVSLATSSASALSRSAS